MNNFSLHISLRKKLNENLLKQIIEKVLDKTFITIEKPLPFIEINICSEKFIRNLNHQFLQKNKVTDVLSFKEQNEITKEEIGQLFICWKKMLRQAKQLNNTWEREFSFLLCHGLLHILDYDHQSLEEEMIMLKLQNEIIGKYQTKTHEINK